MSRYKPSGRIIVIDVRTLVDMCIIIINRSPLLDIKPLYQNILRNGRRQTPSIDFLQKKNKKKPQNLIPLQWLNHAIVGQAINEPSPISRSVLSLRCMWSNIEGMRTGEPCSASRHRSFIVTWLIGFLLDFYQNLNPFLFLRYFAIRLFLLLTNI